MNTEHWVEIEDFPSYMISDIGRVYNRKTEKVINASPTTGGSLRVTLIEGYEMATRAVSTLVAEAFIRKPHESFDTVIQLDGSYDNVTASNLMWRPRWFALKFRAQFAGPLVLKNMSEYTTRPVRNCVTNKHYPHIAAAAMGDGVLAEHILESVRHSSTIWPFDYFYEWS